MEPVKLDFIFDGNTEEEGAKINQTMDDIAKAADKAKEQVKQSISDTRSNIKQMEADIASLEKQLSGAAPGTAKFDLSQELGAAKKALQEEKNILTDLEVRVESTAQKHLRLRTEVMNAKDEFARLERAGKRGGDEWRASAKKLGELNGQMSDTNQQAKILADDEKSFKAVASGVSGLAGAMSAAVGVASLFGAEQEDLVKIQTRLQAVMAITIGVQQVAETLNKDSYFSTVLLTKAKQGWATAQTFLNTQLGIGVGLSRALMISGVGLLIIGIAALVAVYDSWSKKQEEINRLKQENIDLNADVIKSIADEKLQAEQLLKIASDQNRNMATRKDAIDRLNKVMPEYNGYINSEGKLIDNSNQALKEYINNLINVERAKKLAARIAENEGKKEKLQGEQDELNKGGHVNGFKAAWTLASNLGDVKLNKSIGQNYVDIISGNLVDQKLAINKQIGDDKEEMEKLLSNDKVYKGYFGGGDKPTKLSSTAGQAVKEQYDAEKALQEKLIALRQQTTKLQIDIMQDGLQKRLAEIDAEKQAEVNKVTEQQQTIIDAYNKNHKDDKGFVAKTSLKDIPGIDPKTLQDWNNEVAKITISAEEKKKEAIKSANDDIKKIAFDSADKRVQIEQDYQNKIKPLADEEVALRKSAETEKDEAVKAALLERANILKSNQDTLTAEQKKEVSTATASILAETELYKTATDEKLQISAEATARLIEDIKKRIAAEQAAGKLSAKDAKKMLDEVDKAGISRNKNKNENNPFAQLISGIKEYKKAKDAVETAKTSGASPEDFAKLEDAANKTLQSTAAAAGAALQGVQSILGSVVDGMDKLGLLTEEEKKDANDIIGMVGGAANLAMGIASGNPVQIIQGSVDLVVNAISFFDFKSKNIAKQQKKMKADLEDLGRAYQNLQRETNKALGTDVYDKQRESLKNLQNQVADYQRLIELENQKKKKKRDQDAINEWKSQIDSAKAEMEDIVASIRDELTQTDTKSLAGDLANALVDAFQQGEDSAIAFGKVFDNVIRNAVLNAFKLKYLEKPIDKWLNQLGTYMDDGQLTDIEKKALEDYKNQIYQTAQTQFDAVSGFFTDSLGTGTGIQGDVNAMTEDTGSKLTGAINAMRLNVAEITKDYKSGVDIMGRQLAVLEDIKLNTSRLNRIDDNINDMKINGIKIK